MTTAVSGDAADVTITITETARDTRVVCVEPQRAGMFISRKRWETRYPPELIEHVLAVKGPAALCDEIARDEDPKYVEHDFVWDLLSYDAPEAFRGKRILDFGSGSGASSMVLARMFPDSEIVGVELVPEYVELARARVAWYGVDDRVSFLLSPDGNSLPPDIGVFDCIVFSAVFEHLLPAERRTVLPLLWRHLVPGGTLFLDQTPYRWFPIEQHTTGIPLLNYLPTWAALRLARRYCSRVRSDETWESLLRRGIRGGSVREVMHILNRYGRRAVLRRPARNGARDLVDVWYGLSSANPRPFVKGAMRAGFKLIRAATGVTMLPTLSLAIRKEA